MVRKWSYLTTTNLNTTAASVCTIPKAYTFKVFRMTTRFKKFKKHETTFVRKQDSSRKRQTSWLTLVTIFAQWSLQYIKYKQYLRYYQTIGISSTTLVIPNIFVLQKKLTSINSDLTFSTSTLTRTFQKLFVVDNKKELRSTNSLTMLNSNTQHENLFKEVHNSSWHLEKNSFLLASTASSVKKNILTQLFLTPTQGYLSYVVQLYKVMVLLTISKTLICYEVNYAKKLHELNL